MLLLGWSKEFLLCRYSSGPSFDVHLWVFHLFYHLAGENGTSGHSKVTAHSPQQLKSLKLITNGTLAEQLFNKSDSLYSSNSSLFCADLLCIFAFIFCFLHVLSICILLSCETQ